MNGDYQSGGGTLGDPDQLGGAPTASPTPTSSPGLEFEHIVYDGAGGGVVTETVTSRGLGRDRDPVPAIPAARAAPPT